MVIIAGRGVSGYQNGDIGYHTGGSGDYEDDEFFFSSKKELGQYTTTRVVKDETQVVNPKETVIFHTKINMTAMIKERSNVYGRR